MAPFGDPRWKLKHGGGTYNVEIETEGDQAVIYFGASFTLRLDEANIDKLRHALHDASIRLATREYTADNPPEEQAENKFIQDGIAAREQLKAMRMMKGTASPISNDPIDW